MAREGLQKEADNAVKLRLPAGGAGGGGDDEDEEEEMLEKRGKSNTGCSEVLVIRGWGCRLCKSM